MTRVDQDMREFVGMVARMNRLGDPIPSSDGGTYRYEPDGCSDPDAQALYNLIARARDLVAAEEDEHAERLDAPARLRVGGAVRQHRGAFPQRFGLRRGAGAGERAGAGAAGQALPHAMLSIAHTQLRHAEYFSLKRHGGEILRLIRFLRTIPASTTIGNCPCVEACCYCTLDR